MIKNPLKTFFCRTKKALRLELGILDLGNSRSTKFIQMMILGWPLTFYAPPPKSGGVLCYTLWNFECLSVRQHPTILLPTTPTVLGQSFSNFIGAFRVIWIYAYCFFRILKLFFVTFFFSFNLDFFQALILQKCIGSMYLLAATPPTILGQSVSNFTGAFRMVWRYAYCFFWILKLFFITFSAFLT